MRAFYASGGRSIGSMRKRSKSINGVPVRGSEVPIALAIVAGLTLMWVCVATRWLGHRLDLLDLHRDVLRALQSRDALAHHVPPILSPHDDMISSAKKRSGREKRNYVWSDRESTDHGV